MKKTTFIIVLFLSAVLFQQCTEDTETIERPFTRISTLPIENISEEGATFNAAILNDIKDVITSHGFVWGTHSHNLNANTSERIIFNNEPTSKEYSARISSTLKKGESYYVRAFIQTEKYINYGELIYFESKGSRGAQIRGYAPQKIAPNDLITIKGNGFSYIKSNNTVMIDQYPTAVLESTDSTLSVKVPNRLSKASSNVLVTVSGIVHQSDNTLKLAAPEINDFDPKSGDEGTLVTIHGDFFSPIRYNNVVAFNNVNAEIVQATKTELVVRVPPNLTDISNEVSVTVFGQKTTSGSQFITNAHEVFDFLPKQGIIDDEITIIGENFSQLRESNKVFFGNEEAFIVSASETTLKVRVPSGMDPQIKIKVVKSGLERTFETDFTYHAPEINSVSPLKGVHSDKITLTGKNLPFHPDNYKIFFSDVEIETGYLDNNSNDKFYFYVPNGISSKNISLSISIGKHDLGSYDFEYDGGEWVSRYISASNRRPKFLFTIDNKAYFFTELPAGNNLPEHYALYSLDVTTDLWTSLGEVVIPKRFGFASFNANGKGYFGMGRNYLGYGNFDVFSDLWEFDPDTNEFIQVSDFPGGQISEPTTFKVDGSVYIGFYKIGSAQVYSNKIYKFYPSTHTWSEVSEFPGSDRFNPVPITINNEAYFFGGTENSGIGRTIEAPAWKYNPTTNVWTELTSNTQIFYAYPDVANNIFYAFDQVNFYEYDAVNDQWIKIDSKYTLYHGPDVGISRYPIIFENESYIPTHSGSLLYLYNYKRID